MKKIIRKDIRDSEKGDNKINHSGNFGPLRKSEISANCMGEKKFAVGKFHGEWKHRNHLRVKNKVHVSCHFFAEFFIYILDAIESDFARTQERARNFSKSHVSYEEGERASLVKDSTASEIKSHVLLTALKSLYFIITMC